MKIFVWILWMLFCSCKVELKAEPYLLYIPCAKLRGFRRTRYLPQSHWIIVHGRRYLQVTEYAPSCWPILTDVNRSYIRSPYLIPDK